MSTADRLGGDLKVPGAAMRIVPDTHYECSDRLNR